MNIIIIGKLISNKLVHEIQQIKCENIAFIFEIL